MISNTEFHNKWQKQLKIKKNKQPHKLHRKLQNNYDIFANIISYSFKIN